MVSKLSTSLILNAILFQLVWFISVQGNDQHALLALLTLLISHFIIFRPDQQEILLIVAVSIGGILSDTLIMNTGWINYHGASEVFIPIWLCVLWIAFATTLKHSMAWIFRVQWLPAVMGLLLVPLSYWAGIKLSGSEFTVEPAQVLILEGVVWALILTAITIQQTRQEQPLC